MCPASFATMDLQIFMAAAEIARRMVWGFVCMSDGATSSLAHNSDEKEKEFFDSDEEEQTEDSNVKVF